MLKSHWSPRYCILVIYMHAGLSQAKKEPANGKGETKWKQLQHHGVVFPPEYEPHGVPLQYDGEDIKLSPEQVSSPTAHLAATLQHLESMQVTLECCESASGRRIEGHVTRTPSSVTAG